MSALSRRLCQTGPSSAIHGGKMARMKSNIISFTLTVTVNGMAKAEVAGLEFATGRSLQISGLGRNLLCDQRPLQNRRS
ncbi:hypothetical protein PoB_007680500 [Plakobranchus ocellatus]|uniref:Uncharacterized protein n=1 Tax=Plakobranchus ocellatus TaxID=259542 RepID=A0AAV4E1X7_9GAST|nr:hypothetical protein PoB_007680500 [Plakobranchus ocellatus]